MPDPLQPVSMPAADANPPSVAPASLAPVAAAVPGVPVAGPGAQVPAYPSSPAPPGFGAQGPQPGQQVPYPRFQEVNQRLEAALQENATLRAQPSATPLYTPTSPAPAAAPLFPHPSAQAAGAAPTLDAEIARYQADADQHWESDPGRARAAMSAAQGLQVERGISSAMNQVMEHQEKQAQASALQVDGQRFTNEAMRRFPHLGNNQDPRTQAVIQKWNADPYLQATPRGWLSAAESIASAQAAAPMMPAQQPYYPQQPQLQMQPPAQPSMQPQMQPQAPGVPGFVSYGEATLAHPPQQVPPFMEVGGARGAAPGPAPTTGDFHRDYSEVMRDLIVSNGKDRKPLVNLGTKWNLLYRDAMRADQSAPALSYA